MATTSRDPAAAQPVPVCQEEKAREAMALMVEALCLIDASQGTGIAGAHLDLAIHRLQEWIDSAASR
jgi:hypothetical protein